MSKGNQNCGNCRFWLRLANHAPVYDDDGNEYFDGICRRHPPTVVGTGEYGNVRPTVTTAQWCGEWQAENPATLELTVVALARQALAGDPEAGRALADRVMELTPG